jgi:ABC-type multidrug transport system fused ATPase/permease subunit
MIKSLLRNISFLNKKEKILFIFTLCLLSISTFLEVLSLGMFIPLIDFYFKIDNIYIKKIIQYTKFSPENLFFLLIVLLFFFFIFKNIFLFFANYFQNFFLRVLYLKVLKKIFSSYIKSKYSFHLTKNNAELMRNVRSAHFLVDNMQCYLILVLEIFLLFFILLVLLYSSFLATLIIACLLFFISIFVFNFQKEKFSEWGKIQTGSDLDINKILLNSFNSIKEIKILNKENYIINVFNKVVERNSLAIFNINTFLQLPRYIFEVLLILSVILAFIFLHIKDSSIESIASTLSIFFLASIRILPGINRIVTYSQRIVASRSIKNIILNEINSLVFFDTINQNKILFNTLEVVNLNFNFADRSLLKNISFKLNKGEVLGIIGPSGSGKSTLLNIITGLLDFGHGKVLINHQDISNIKNGWQKTLGYVSQNIFVLDASLKDNICLFNEEKFDQDRFEKSIRLSRLDKLIKELPQGIDTIVGEKGKLVSGGEAQRLGIARALYIDPDVIIFDEATNALNIDLEREIMNDIKNLRKIKTIIIVSHNLENISFCDKIVDLGKNL